MGRQLKRTTGTDAPRALESYRILMVQSGPCTADVQANIESLVEFTSAELAREPADLIVLPELATLPYFCIVEDPQLFDWAEPLEGPTVTAFADLARRHQTNVVVPLFERNSVRGSFFDSAVVLNRLGEVVTGHLHDKRRPVRAYRKVHISSHFDYRPSINEKYYFRGGPGFAIFEIDGLRVGCLICYDRSFPEAWRVLALSGAQIVAIMSASYARRRSESFLFELQTASMQNGVFAISANKGGTERFRNHRMDFFGSSCAIDPLGAVIAHHVTPEGPVGLRAGLDLSLLEESARRYHYMRDRRTDTYGYLLGEGSIEQGAPSVGQGLSPFVDLQSTASGEGEGL